MTPTKAQLFSRQLQLKEITSVGQNKLLQAKVVVVGCGGLGGAAAVHLAASGVGHIHLVDFDTVAISNLHRQVFFTLDDVGALKAEVLKNVITKEHRLQP
jgi:Dinucleotide-utilizing enzymes involved in molybdopterin and thiamine biosynthesis family 2